MEPAIHFAVPLLALTLAGVEPRRAIPLSLLALVPDLDALFLLHRSPSHSIILLMAFGLPLLLLAYRFNRGLLRGLSYGLLSIASHPILDLFNGYTPILWPLYGYSLWVRAGLQAQIGGSLSLKPSLRIYAEPTVFQPLRSLEAQLFTGESLMVLSILFAPLLLKAYGKALRRVSPS